MDQPKFREGARPANSSQTVLDKMLMKSFLVVASAARSLAATVPQSSYGGNLRPLVSSKPLQDLVTTEGYVVCFRHVFDC